MTRLTAKQYLEQAAKPKRNKYGAKRTVVDGILFDSKAEASRYIYLREREARGEISHLELQPSFKLCGRDGTPLRYDSGRQAVYRADFAYFEPSKNKRVVEDVKSKATKTQVYKLKKALVEANFPAVKIEEV